MQHRSGARWAVPALPSDHVKSGPFAPFGIPAFAVLWTATVISNVGTWMHEIGAGWLMTSLNPSPLMVAAVQSATALPIFIFALPAGALADLVDRRQLLLRLQIGMAVVAVLMALVVALDGMSAPVLLIFTFALGAGTAFLAPAWQAIVPGLVPRDQLPAAIALNSIGINISRAIGPALGGAIIVAFGIAWPFILNAVSFLAVIAALIWWQGEAQAKSHLPAERFFEAMRSGIRYARASKPLRHTLARAIGFFFFASAFWALLPLIVRQELAGDASLYGIFLGCVGAGAVTGAFVLNPLKTRFNADQIVAMGTGLMAGVLLVFAITSVHLILGTAAFLAGTAWIAVLANLNVSAQTSLAEWVRARGLSVFIAVFFGAMTLGSLTWGQLASLTSIPVTLAAAAAGASIAIALTRKFHLQQGAKLDLSPSMHWPEPIIEAELAADQGPVVITVDYQIADGQMGDFLAAMQMLKQERLGLGAFAWSLAEDLEKPGQMLETFHEASWLAHQRHHERVTEAGRALQARIRQTLSCDPIVRHLIIRT